MPLCSCRSKLSDWKDRNAAPLFQLGRNVSSGKYPRKKKTVIAFNNCYRNSIQNVSLLQKVTHACMSRLVET